MRRGVLIALSLLGIGLTGTVAEIVLRRPTGIALYGLTTFTAAFLIAAELLCRRKGLMCSWRP